MIFKDQRKAENVTDDDLQSIVSIDYGDEIRKLMNEVDSLKKTNQDDLYSEEVSLDPTVSSDPKEAVGNTHSFQQMMWDSFPDSLETAMTTSEEKLQATQESLRHQLANKNNQILYNVAASTEVSRFNLNF